MTEHYERRMRAGNYAVLLYTILIKHFKRITKQIVVRRGTCVPARGPRTRNDEAEDAAGCDSIRKGRLVSVLQIALFSGNYCFSYSLYLRTIYVRDTENEQRRKKNGEQL